MIKRPNCRARTRRADNQFFGVGQGPSDARASARLGTSPEWSAC